MKIAPSILTADFNILKEEILSIGHSDYLHLDVMDGHFVPNISFGSHVLSGLKKITSIPLDTHLMIENPLQYIDQYVEIGSSIITIHVEANQPLESICRIKASGIKAGISLKPKTPLEDLFPYLDKVDLVLVMSVEPGFGGQSFMEDQLEKVRELKRLREAYKYNYIIEIDGGINGTTAPKAKEAGVDLAVAGSYVFNAKDRNKAIDAIR
ncbi:ribulose-phosphate 3-epimerase [Acholeplasma morum]|jgi:ribulose-phosphate 3-epimerase|uniref:ribulose-phosphate 3-epimerase n=1 Tax=Paracholeplasma morum TaxID=264637 RepID=UPI0019562E39|nr:ribulose-phosphate 3-epimerase [Paracholeplasma morum]MBM7454069.1 ribulose-phosphate 3-epimerase [Paracholeplasma morum]